MTIWPALVLAVGVCSAFACAAVLTGWWLQVPRLKSILPGLVSMKPNTALAFVLAGAVLALLTGPPVSPRRARTGQLLALLVALIGGLTLGEYLFGWHLGIDELLFKDDPNAIATTMPGRMAPSTAACFVLLGLALLGIEWEPRRGLRPAELLALGIAFVSVSSLVEYAVGQPILYGFSEYTRMALHTAAVFLGLSAGVLLARPAQGVVGALRSGSVSLLETAFHAAMGLALLVVLAGGAWFYRAQEQQARRAVGTELESVARLKVDQIAQWRTEHLGDAAVLMGSHFFAEGVARWMADPQTEVGDKILARFRAMQEYNHYEDVLLVDGRGQVRLSASGRPSAFHADLVEALATAFRTRQPVFTDLHCPPGDLTPHFDVIAPLFAGNETASEPIGAVILQQEARQFLYPLIRSWPTPSRSAETLLVRRDGDSVLFLNELRHRPDAAFKLRIPFARREVPAVMAILDKEGVFHGTDYRGVEALSVLKRIPNTSWFIVAKIDEAEALTEWHSLGRLIVAVILALGLMLAAAARMIWEQRKKRHVLAQSFEALRKANRAYRVLSEGNQALVRADDELQLLRAVCQIVVEHGGYRLAWVGYAEDDEARSLRPVAHAGVEDGYLEGLQLTWADTERGRGPTGTAIRTGRSNVAQNILHDERFAPWRAEALRHGYAASVSLPLTGQGRTFGVLGVYAAEPNAFDEQELKLLEELANDLAFGIAVLRLRAEREHQEQVLTASEQRYRSLVEVSPDAIFVNRENQIVLINAAGLKLLGATDPAQVLGRSPLDFFHPEGHPLIQERIRMVLEKKQAVPLAENKLLRLDGSVVSVETTAAPFEDRGVTSIQVVVRDITERKRADAALREAEWRYRALFEQSPAGILLIDPVTGIPVQFNDTAACQLGYTRDEFGRLRISDYEAAENPEETQGRIERILQGGRQDFETLHRTKQGDVRNVLVTVQMIELGGRSLLHAVFRDVTDIRRVEEEIRKLNAELEQRVQERTHQLAEANKELVAFNRVMVAREQRIIEMKEEVNALCRELGREPEYPPVWRKEIPDDHA